VGERREKIWHNPRVIVSPRVAFLLSSALTLACATQREQRLSSAEARERPSDDVCVPKGRPPKPGWVWACGYWHWETVRYVWVEGEWRAGG
jgi:hypothetical protein